MADFNIEGWFSSKGLPFTDNVSITLDNFGVVCVEQLKMLPREDFMEMFKDGKFITKKTAELAVDELHSTPIDLSKCGTSSNLESAVERFKSNNPLNSRKNPGRPRKIRNGVTQQTATKFRGRGVGKRASVGDPLLENIVSQWCLTGQQNNMVRLHVCNALREGHSKSSIARVIRLECFGREHPWDGVGSSDRIYKKIKATLLRIHNDWKSGKLSDITQKSGPAQQRALLSKTVKPGSRGRTRGALNKKSQANHKVEVFGEKIEDSVDLGRKVELGVDVAEDGKIVENWGEYEGRKDETTIDGRKNEIMTKSGGTHETRMYGGSEELDVHEANTSDEVVPDVGGVLPEQPGLKDAKITGGNYTVV
mmetsp:Transcript_28065/g.58760  ORF Transcript_28065/g.58760 Transcript_28065/m.58760 type:complete len:365 (+) Transcript_28065:39-1133(+)